MTDYSQLSDADINAAIAVRVCGHTGVRFIKDHPWGLVRDLTAKEINDYAVYGIKHECLAADNYCGHIQWAFVAQSALAAKGQEYIGWHEFIIRNAILLETEQLPEPNTVWKILTADARARCIAMLQAVDECEKNNA